MGACTSSGIRNNASRDDEDKEHSDSSTDVAEQYQKAVSRNNKRASIASRLAFRPAMVTADDFVGMLGNPSCYWVYARFSDNQNFANQFVYALDIKEKKYVPLPNPPMNTLVGNASAVLDYNLYLIGGQRGPYVHSLVHVFEPLKFDWADTNGSILLARRGAIAVTLDGKVYVFGGCDIIHSDRWGEVYDPSTKQWAAVPSSDILVLALYNGLQSLRTCVVLGKQIILRGSGYSLALDVPTGSWTIVSDRLVSGWWDFIRAAVVQNLLITCHCGDDDKGRRQLSIQAYDPDGDVWLPLKGIDKEFHENAHRSQFLAVNGKLVIYHVWERNDLRFSVFQIKERCQESVKVKLLFQSRFPISKLIKRGNYMQLSGVNLATAGRPHKGKFALSVIEAARAEGLQN